MADVHACKDAAAFLWRRVVRPCCLALSLGLPALVDASPLIIVGGALRSDTASVYRAFIDALPAEGPIAIIPAASGSPAQSADSFKDDLVRYGVPGERVTVVEVAVRDDRSTADVDESDWHRNAWVSETMEPLANAAGFWFTGGDQSRIVAALRDPAGKESPLLALVRNRAQLGAVIGGTSAGAAVMSLTMITDGDSMGALLHPVALLDSSDESLSSTPLSLGDGLGFLRHGVVDQHFDRRARLGRLVRAVAEAGEARGYGVDENTALQVDEVLGTATVLGAGSVTVIDASAAEFNFEADRLVGGVRLSVFPAGVTFRLDTLTPISGAGKETVGNEYNDQAPFQGGGMALPNSRLGQLLGYELLDNRRASRLERPTIRMDGRGLVYRFTQDDRSQGFWHSSGAQDRYTLLSVRLDVDRLAFDPGQ